MQQTSFLSRVSRILFAPRKIVVVTERQVKHYEISSRAQKVALALTVAGGVWTAYASGVSVSYHQHIMAKNEQVRGANLAREQAEDKLLLAQQDVLRLREYVDDPDEYGSFILKQYSALDGDGLDQEMPAFNHRYDLVDKALNERVTYLEKQISSLEAYREQVIRVAQENIPETVDHLENVITMTGLSLKDLGLQNDKQKAMRQPPNKEEAAESNTEKVGESETAALDNDADTTGQGGPLVPAQEKTFSPEEASHAVERLGFLLKLSKVIESLPIAHPVPKSRITSGFGMRIDPFTKNWARHQGMDFVGRHRGPIRATANGTITFAGTKAGYGRVVEIRHANGLSTRYGHLAKITVRNGQRVSRGERIGLQGNSGRSTGSHLHYEIRYKGNAINPGRFVRAGKHVL